MDFGERLKAERKKLGLSQTEFAKKLGISKNTQFNYENMASDPDVAYLGRLDELGINTRYLITGEAAEVSEEELLRQADLIHEIVFELEKILVTQPGVKLSPHKKASLVRVLFKLYYPTGYVDLDNLNELLTISKD